MTQRDQSDYHRCPFPGCTQRVPYHLWGCKAHWYRVPRDLRLRLSRAWRDGRRDDHVDALMAIDEFFGGAQ